MTSRRLLEALEADGVERLRHALLREAGIDPFSLRARLISRRALLREACHLVLDRRQSGGSGSFDEDRFRALIKEAER